MFKKVLFIIFIFIIFNAESFAQAWSRYKYEGYYGVGLTNFMGDIPAPTSEHPTGDFIWINLFNTIGYTANAGLRYNFKDRQYYSGAVFIGQMYGKDPSEDPKYWDRGFEFKSFFTEITAKYEYAIIKEKKKSTVYRKLGESRFKNFSLPTYLFIGAGAIVNYGKYSETVNEGKNIVSQNYFNVAPTIPFGFGFKYKINRLTYLNLEASWRVALGDKLDNAAGKDNPKFGTWIDQYQSITFNIVHKLRQNQNGTPKFKRK